MSAGQFRKSKHTATPAPVAAAKSFVDEMPRFQWANRWELQEYDTEGEPIRKSGWVCKRGESKALDEAAQELQLPWFSYKHQGGGATVVYWHLKAAHFYFAVTGVLSSWDMDKDLEKRTGFSYARTERGNGDTILRIAGFCEELYDAGFKDPIYISVSKRMAFQHMMGALIDHYRALKKFAELRGNPDELPAYYEVATFLVPGKPVQFGTAATSLGVPVVSGLPQDVTREYLLEHYIGLKKRKELFDRIEEPGDDGTVLIDELLEWSSADSKRIYALTNDKQGVAGADPEATSYMTKGAKPAAPRQEEVVEDLPF